MGQMDFISSIFVRCFFFFKIILEARYRCIGWSVSPHCLCILPWFSNSGDTQISMYIRVPFSHAVFFKKHLRSSSVIFDQATIYMCSLVGFFCSSHFSVKQLTFEIYIILCQYSYHSFKFGEINILDCNFLSSSYGNESHKSVGYGKYTTLNMVLFLHLIGRKLKEVGGSWAKYKFWSRGMYVLGTMTIPQYYEKGQYLYMVSTSPMYTVSTPPLHISPIHTVKTKGQYISTSIKLYVVDIRGRREDLSRRYLFGMVYSGMRSQLKVCDIFVRTADNSENPVFGLIDNLFFFLLTSNMAKVSKKKARK